MAKFKALPPTYILSPLNCYSKKRLFEELSLVVSPLAECQPRDLLYALNAREANGSTICANQIGMPHAVIETLKTSIAVLTILPQTIPYNTIDADPEGVDIAFAFFFSMQDDYEEYEEILRHLYELFENPDLGNSLRRSWQDPIKLRQILTKVDLHLDQVLHPEGEVEEEKSNSVLDTLTGIINKFTEKDEDEPKSESKLGELENAAAAALDPLTSFEEAIKQVDAKETASDLKNSNLADKSPASQSSVLSGSLAGSMPLDELKSAPQQARDSGLNNLAKSATSAKDAISSKVATASKVANPSLGTLPSSAQATDNQADSANSNLLDKHAQAISVASQGETSAQTQSDSLELKNKTSVLSTLSNLLVKLTAEDKLNSSTQAAAGLGTQVPINPEIKASSIQEAWANSALPDLASQTASDQKPQDSASAQPSYQSTQAAQAAQAAQAVHTVQAAQETQAPNFTAISEDTAKLAGQDKTASLAESVQESDKQAARTEQASSTPVSGSVPVPNPASAYSSLRIGSSANIGLSDTSKNLQAATTTQAKSTTTAGSVGGNENVNAHGNVQGNGNAARIANATPNLDENYGDNLENRTDSENETAPENACDSEPQELAADIQGQSQQVLEQINELELKPLTGTQSQTGLQTQAKSSIWNRFTVMLHHLRDHAKAKVKSDQATPYEPISYAQQLQQEPQAQATQTLPSPQTPQSNQGPQSSNVTQVSQSMVEANTGTNALTNMVTGTIPGPAQAPTVEPKALYKPSVPATNASENSAEIAPENTTDRKLAGESTSQIDITPLQPDLSNLAANTVGTQVPADTSGTVLVTTLKSESVAEANSDTEANYGTKAASESVLWSGTEPESTFEAVADAGTGADAGTSAESEPTYAPMQESHKNLTLTSHDSILTKQEAQQALQTERNADLQEAEDAAAIIEAKAGAEDEGIADIPHDAASLESNSQKEHLIDD